MPRPSRVLVAAVAASALMAGCGGSGPEDTVQDFIDAAKDGDGEKLCDLLVEDIRERVESEASEGCPQALEQALGDEASRQEAADTEVKDSEEDGDEATVTVEGPNGEEDVQLRKEAGDWRISVPLGHGPGQSPAPAPAPAPEQGQGQGTTP
jgi:hypothetical protein